MKLVFIYRSRAAECKWSRSKSRSKSRSIYESRTLQFERMVKNKLSGGGTELRNGKGKRTMNTNIVVLPILCEPIETKRITTNISKIFLF